MAFFRRILDFYIGASLHVALAVLALVLMTQHMFGITGRPAMPLFAFFATVTGYNFVKYHTIAFSRTERFSRQLRAVIALSALASAGAVFFFLKLGFMAQAATAIFGVLTLLYALPFFPNRKNARNWAGVKIYIVALCWAGVTVVLPLLDAGIELTTDFYLKCIQRFILVFVLILIFEIVDIGKDDPLLQTVPQQIGQEPTKVLGIALLAVFFVLELLRSETRESQLWANLVLIVITSVMLLFAAPTRSRYYSVFWAEAIPVLWYLLILAM